MRAGSLHQDFSSSLNPSEIIQCLLGRYGRYTDIDIDNDTLAVVYDRIGQKVPTIINFIHCCLPGELAVCVISCIEYEQLSNNRHMIDQQLPLGA